MVGVEMCFNCCTEDKNDAVFFSPLKLLFITLDVMGYFAFTTHAIVSFNKPKHSFSF